MLGCPAGGRRVKGGHARGRCVTGDGWPRARRPLAPAAGGAEDGQFMPICLASWLVISTLRGLAASCTGMARVSTPAV